MNSYFWCYFIELESYSTVVGAFRAQGKLSSSKLRILKDLRGAFHISDDRHKAEIRRVVNDEYLSTVANMYVLICMKFTAIQNESISNQCSH